MEEVPMMCSLKEEKGDAFAAVLFYQHGHPGLKVCYSLHFGEEENPGLP